MSKSDKTTQHLRDGNAQQKYMENSTAEPGKQAAHIESLAIANEIEKHKPGPESSTLKPTINDPRNFQAEGKIKNLNQDTSDDKAIIDKGMKNTDKPLTQAQESRVEHVVDSIHDRKEKLTKGEMKASGDFFKNLDEPGGSTHWDKGTMK